MQRPLLNLHDLCEGHGNVTENDHMQPEGPITQVPLHGNLPAASLYFVFFASTTRVSFKSESCSLDMHSVGLYSYL